MNQPHCSPQAPRMPEAKTFGSCIAPNEKPARFNLRTALPGFVFLASLAILFGASLTNRLPEQKKLPEVSLPMASNSPSDEQSVVTIGPPAKVVAAHCLPGESVWQIDMDTEFGPGRPGKSLRKFTCLGPMNSEDMAAGMQAYGTWLAQSPPLIPGANSSVMTGWEPWVPPASKDGLFERAKSALFDRS